MQSLLLIQGLFMRTMRNDYEELIRKAQKARQFDYNCNWLGNWKWYQYDIRNIITWGFCKLIVMWLIRRIGIMRKLLYRNGLNSSSMVHLLLLFMPSCWKFVYEETVPREGCSHFDQLANRHSPQLCRRLENAKFLKKNENFQIVTNQFIEVVAENQAVVDVQTRHRLFIVNGEHFVAIRGVPFDALFNKLKIIIE